MQTHERIAKAIQASGKKKIEIAAYCGVAPSAITQWIKGESKSLKPENLFALASVTGFSAKWLALGVGPEKDRDINVAETIQPTRSFPYPEISWVQAGMPVEALQQVLCSDEIRIHASDAWAGENGFWLSVTGPSMTSASGLPTFPEGTLILVAPGVMPENGQFCVAKLIDGPTHESTFKQFFRDAGRAYLQPLNKSFPIIELNGEWEITGTVVDAKMPRSVFR